MLKGTKLRHDSREHVPCTAFPSQVHFTLQYEPYVVVRRSDSPIYDERFLQRFFNKVVHLYALYVRRSVHKQCTPVGVQLVHGAIFEQCSLLGYSLCTGEYANDTVLLWLLSV